MAVMLEDPLLEDRSCKGAEHYILGSVISFRRDKCLDINRKDGTCTREIEKISKIAGFNHLYLNLSTSKTDKNGIHR